ATADRHGAKPRREGFMVIGRPADATGKGNTIPATPFARTELARNAFRRPGMSRPSETEALLQEAGALLEKDQFAAAVPLIDRALATDPQSDYGLWYRGCALSALGRHAE